MSSKGLISWHGSREEEDKGQKEPKEEKFRREETLDFFLAKTQL